MRVYQSKGRVDQHELILLDLATKLPKPCLWGMCGQLQRPDNSGFCSDSCGERYIKRTFQRLGDRSALASTFSLIAGMDKPPRRKKH